MPIDEYGVKVTFDGRDATRNADRLADSVDRVGRESDQTQRAMKRLSGSSNVMSRAWKALATAAAGYAALRLGQQALEIADQYSQLTTRIRTATKHTGDYAAVQRRLFEITKANGGELANSVSLFQSLARVAPELNATNQQMLTLTNAVQQLGIIGGSTNEQMSNGLLQFTQGLAAGTFRAEEFNSLLENTPEIAARIASGMGKTVGELRKMVLNGELLSQDVFQTLVEQAPQINEEFGDIPLTIERGAAQLQTTMVEVIGRLDQASGLSASIAGFLSGVGTSIDEALNGPRIADVTAEIEQLEAALIRLGDGNQQLTRRGVRGPTRSGIESQLAALREELTLLKAAEGDIDSIKTLISGLEEEITRLESGGVSRPEKNRLKQLNEQLSERNKQLEMAEEQTRKANEAAQEQTEVYRELEDSEQKLIDKLLPHEAAQRKLNEQMVILKKAQAEAGDGAANFDGAIKALEKSMDELNNGTSNLIKNLDKETVALQKELSALKKGELAHRSFTRTQKINNELRRLNAYDLLPEETEQIRRQISAQYDLAEAIEIQKESNEEATKRLEENNDLWKEWATDIVYHVIDGADNIRDVFSRLLDDLKRSAAESVIKISLGLEEPSSAGIGFGDVFSLGKSLLPGADGGGFDLTKIFTTGGSAAFGGLNPATVIALAYAGGQIGTRAGDKIGEALFGKEAESSLGKDIGQWFGIVGGLAGSLADVAFGGDGKKDLTLGVTAGTNPGVRDKYVRNSVEGASGLQLSSIARRLDDEGKAVADQLLQTFLQLDSALFNTAANLGQAVDLDGVSLSGKGTNGKNSTAVQSFFGSAEYNKISKEDIANSPGAFIRAWSAEVGGEFDSLFKRIADGLNDEQISNNLDGLLYSINSVGTATGDLKSIYDSFLSTGTFSDLIQEGEVAAITLTRLATNTVATNAVLENIDLTVFEIGEAGIRAANGLTELFGGIEGLANASAQYYAAFYTEEEKFTRLTDQLTTSFEGLGYVLPATRDGIRNLVDGLDLTAVAGQEGFAAIMTLVPALDQYYSALENQTTVVTTASTAVDTLTRSVADLQKDASGLLSGALKGVSSAISAQQKDLTSEFNAYREAARGQIDDINDRLTGQLDSYNDHLSDLNDRASQLSSIVSDIGSAISSLSGGNSLGSRRNALGFIQSQIAAGGVNDVDGLRSALGVLTQDSKGLFATRSDYLADRARSRNALIELQGITGGQLGTTNATVQAIEASMRQAEEVAEEQIRGIEDQLAIAEDHYKDNIKALDRLLESSTDQVNAILGVEDGVLSVSDAINTLSGVISEFAEQAILGTQSSSRVEGHNNIARAITADGMITDTEAMQAYAIAVSEGYSKGEVAYALGITEREVTDWISRNGLPQFASGGVHSGGLRVVGEMGPELEFTGPSNIVSNNDLIKKLSNEELVKEIRALRQELLAANRSIAKHTSKTASVLNRWEIDGQPEVRA